MDLTKSQTGGKRCEKESIGVNLYHCRRYQNNEPDGVACLALAFECLAGVVNTVSPTKYGCLPACGPIVPCSTLHSLNSRTCVHSPSDYRTVHTVL
jgi:hypothetical protein